MNNFDKIQKYISYAQHMLEEFGYADFYEDDILDEHIKDFQKIMKDIVIFVGSFQGLSKKEAIDMFKQDLDELEEQVGGS